MTRLEILTVLYSLRVILKDEDKEKAVDNANEVINSVIAEAEKNT